MFRYFVINKDITALKIEPLPYFGSGFLVFGEEPIFYSSNTINEQGEQIETKIMVRYANENMPLLSTNQVYQTRSGKHRLINKGNQIMLGVNDE